MKAITIETAEKIFNLFKYNITYRVYDDTYEFCITDSFDLTGNRPEHFGCLVVGESIEELIYNLNTINIESVVATEYDIRTDGVDDEYIKDACEKWGETLKSIKEKILTEIKNM